jgi:hypothetical protein
LVRDGLALIDKTLKSIEVIAKLRNLWAKIFVTTNVVNNLSIHNAKIGGEK